MQEDNRGSCNLVFLSEYELGKGAACHLWPLVLLRDCYRPHHHLALLSFLEILVSEGFMWCQPRLSDHMALGHAYAGEREISLNPFSQPGL